MKGRAVILWGLCAGVAAAQCQSVPLVSHSLQSQELDLILDSVKNARQQGVLTDIALQPPLRTSPTGVACV